MIHRKILTRKIQLHGSQIVKALAQGGLEEERGWFNGLFDLLLNKVAKQPTLIGRNSIADRLNNLNLSVQHKNAKVTLLKLAAVDWTKQDIVLAKELGVSRERVRQYRVALEMPKSANHKKHSKIRYPELHKAAQAGELNHLSASEISKKFRISPSYVSYHIRKKYGLKLPRCSKLKEVGTYFNWYLPNRVLEDIWGLPYYFFASNRSRLKIGRQKWGASNPGTLIDPEFKKAVEQEKQKAAEKPYLLPYTSYSPTNKFNPVPFNYDEVSSVYTRGICKKEYTPARNPESLMFKVDSYIQTKFQGKTFFASDIWALFPEQDANTRKCICNRICQLVKYGVLTRAILVGKAPKGKSRAVYRLA